MATHAETRALMQKSKFEEVGRAWVSMIDDNRGVVLSRVLPSKAWTRQVKWEDPAVVSAAGEAIFQRVEKAMRNLDAHGVVVLKEVACRIEGGTHGKPRSLTYLPQHVPASAVREEMGDSPQAVWPTCPVVLQPDNIVDYTVTEPTPIREEDAELASQIRRALERGGSGPAVVLGGGDRMVAGQDAVPVVGVPTGFGDWEQKVAGTNGSAAGDGYTTLKDADHEMVTRKENAVVTEREFVSVGAHDDIEWELVDNAPNRGDIAQVSIVLGGNSAEIALNKRSRDILGTEYIRVHISKKGDAVALDPSDRSDFSAFKVAENGRFSAGVVVKKLGLSNVPGEMRTIRMEGLQDGKRLVAILPAILPD